MWLVRPKSDLTSPDYLALPESIDGKIRHKYLDFHPRSAEPYPDKGGNPPDNNAGKARIQQGDNNDDCKKRGLYRPEFDSTHG